MINEISLFYKLRNIRKFYSIYTQHIFVIDEAHAKDNGITYHQIFCFFKVTGNEYMHLLIEYFD